MSLNSSSGSASHAMTHRAKQQSMNDQRRKANALKGKTEIVEPEVVGPVIKSEEKIVVDLNEILQPHSLSENRMTLAHDRIIYSLDNNNPKEKYILEIISELNGNLIQRVKKGTYFEVGGKLYRVTDTLFTKGGIVEAKEVHPQNSDDIFARHTFTTNEVLHNMIPENEAHTRIAQLIMESKPGKNDFSGIYESIMDRAGRIMADVDWANAGIHRRNYPAGINDKGLITKIPEPYFNKDNPDA